ncbi:hypothetical protein J3R30DRAFT_3418027 [Lentinula aciculospora]|uniref:Mid2 domain-containing protein n=1 Tax=Lentinula aciculospora TaxID=153920 RepID=A0A9W9AT71_9AGAR|nr:hypothetical protein J3R30DRAFT_3418027 [Lentinula aciculospora]
MRSSFVFLSLGAAAAGFRFTGVPSSASANQASSATLIRDSSDPTAFSLILRLTSQNGGSTIKEFPAEQGTNIPFSFTPTESGVFIIEVISNLSPISDTQEPDQIYASSSSIDVGTDNQASLPSSTFTSSSESAGTSTLSQSTNAASTNVDASQTTSNNNGNTAQPSSTTPLTSVDATHDSSNGNSVVTTASTTQTNSDTASSIVTNVLSSSVGSSGQGALASNASRSSTVASPPASSTNISGTSSISSTNTSAASTATLAPIATSSKSFKTGMIIGIVFGVLAFVGLCLALLVAYTRYQQRKRTNTFKRQLMTRQISPLVFNRVAPSPSTAEETGSGDGDGYREYVPEDDYNRDIVEAGTTQSAESNQASSSSHLHSMYSEQSVHSVYSDSPSIFYTAVPAPRTVGAASTGLTATSSQTLSVAPYSTLGLTFNSDLQSPPSSQKTSIPSPGSTAAALQMSPSQPTSASALPQLAPGWVFPRAQPRLSQLPPPKTDRQMDIYDRKVRLQGKLIGLQGWGNVDASESQRVQIAAVKEQIRKLDDVENSDWALGKSNEVPILGLGLS